jgi:hypothetical protein
MALRLGLIKKPQRESRTRAKYDFQGTFSAIKKQAQASALLNTRLLLKLTEKIRIMRVRSSQGLAPIALFSYPSLQGRAVALCPPDGAPQRAMFIVAITAEANLDILARGQPTRMHY